ncbi:tyrosine-type recombinase/integrase [Flavobacterium sp.]|jgi:integrase|uniref:tyrosine-type recombinase/integrase n=1 Tax=Flavobacterium sp. TaxID=239 RepID=UPI00261472AF|nr:tyrosine-type recombinase/integrase [Flavobacterium sp.]
MKKLTLPKNHLKGLKIYCNKCKKYNPKCNHNDDLLYRVVVHIPGTKNSTKIKTLISKNYEDAVKESIDIIKELKSNDYRDLSTDNDNKEYTMIGAILKYNQFLSGEYELKHLIKKVSEGHRKESLRFIKLFCNVLKSHHNFEIMRVRDVSVKDVSRFYESMESHYSARTFNKCMISLKSFFNFLIEIEKVDMKNPFSVYNSKSVLTTINETITKDEFERILDSIDSSDSLLKLGGKGEVKNMYRDYLKLGFKLFLLTGGRREEVVDLRWSDIYYSGDTYFFMIKNKKVERNQNIDGDFNKYIPINSDLFDLLNEIGYEEKKTSKDFILCPERNESVLTIMNTLSKSFTFYKNKSGVTKNISLKHLRKTYISWVNQVMGTDTRILTSHSTDGVLKEHYLDPTILDTIQKGMLNIKVFGQ